MKKNIFILLMLLLPIVLAQSSIDLPLFGNLDINLPLPLLGAILGFIDGGFNPCALSVLLFLIAYLMGIGSKKKSLVIGFVYSAIIFIVYFLFMYGVLNLLSIIGYLEIIKKIVGIVIIIAGLIEIKDFVWYGKWFSLEIPKFAKPTIEKLTKSATISSAIILGLFVSIVEIPCAGVFPLIYLTLLAEMASGAMSVIYLIWYNIFFVLPLLLLTLIFYFGWAQVEKAEKTRLKLRKYMRLIAGLIMISLGVAMLLKVI